jgi:tRNA pseudouridine38-40 synthase
MVDGRRIALLVEYDGTAFAGSQAQDGQRTVQGVMENALYEFSGERQRVAFAGRTDAGVHALGQVVALRTATAHDPATFRRALNHFLPEDVTVRAVAEPPADFDPRRQAQSRVYRYEIDDGHERSALRRHRAWQLRQRLDEAAMDAAASALLRGPARGERDWAAFAGAVPDGYPTVRTLTRIDVRRCGPHRLTVTMEADGFLPHQVRRTVGALERVGRGKLSAQAFARLAEGPPSSAGPAAPPQGLTLLAVRYAPQTLTWDDVDELAEGAGA